MLEFEALVDLDETLESLITAPLEYKYFIAQKTSNQKDSTLFLKQIEYNSRKLEILNSNSLVNETSDKWPLIDTESKPTRIDHGWLLHGEHEFQFHFFNNPIQLWHVDSKNLCFNIVPWKANNGLYELKDYCINHVVSLFEHFNFICC